jgi:hypothetical protein
MLIIVAVLSLLVAPLLRAQAPEKQHGQLAREILRELIEINTTEAAGTTKAAEAHGLYGAGIAIAWLFGRRRQPERP